MRITRLWERDHDRHPCQLGVQCFPRTIDVHLGSAGQRFDLGDIWQTVLVVIERCDMNVS